MGKENFKKEEKEVVEIEFTKEQLVSSKKYSKYKDILNAMLEIDKKYTDKQAQEIIENFMKGKVK